MWGGAASRRWGGIRQQHWAPKLAVTGSLEAAPGSMEPGRGAGRGGTGGVPWPIRGMGWGLPCSACKSGSQPQDLPAKLVSYLLEFGRPLSIMY